MSVFSSYAEMKQSYGDENRKERSQRLTELSQGFVYDKETDALNKTEQRQNQEKVKEQETEAKLQALDANLTALKSQASADGITNTLTSVMDGNWEDAKFSYNKIKQTLAEAKGLNVADINQVNFSDFNDMNQLEDMGVDTEKINSQEIADSFNRSFIKVTGHDGQTRVVPVDNILKATNTWNMMSKTQRDKATENTNYINSVISGKGFTYQEQQDAKASSELGRDKMGIMQKAVDSGDPTQVMEALKLTNPELFVTKGSAKPANLKSQYELGKLIDTDSMNKYVLNNRDDFNTLLRTGAKNTNVQGKKLYEIASTYQDDAKPDTATMSQLNGTVSTITSLESLEKDIDDADIDYDAFSKIMTSIKSIGIDFMDLSEDQIKDHALKIGVDTKKNLIMIKLIKAMSGLTVSDRERDIYSTSILSGNWSDKTSALASIRASIEELSKGSKDILGSFIHNYPKTYLDHYGDLNKLSPDKEVTVNPSTPGEKRELESKFGGLYK